MSEMVACPTGTCPAELAGFPCPGATRATDAYCRMALAGHGDRIADEARRLAGQASIPTAEPAVMPGILGPTPAEPGAAMARSIRECRHRRPVGCACLGIYACVHYEVPATTGECLACVADGGPPD